MEKKLYIGVNEVIADWGVSRAKVYEIIKDMNVKLKAINPHFINKRKPGVLLSVSKSEMVWDIVRLMNDGAIDMDNLNDFNEELCNEVRCILKFTGR